MSVARGLDAPTWTGQASSRASSQVSTTLAGLRSTARTSTGGELTKSRRSGAPTWTARVLSAASSGAGAAPAGLPSRRVNSFLPGWPGPGTTGRERLNQAESRESHSSLETARRWKAARGFESHPRRLIGRLGSTERVSVTRVNRLGASAFTAQDRWRPPEAGDDWRNGTTLRHAYETWGHWVALDLDIQQIVRIRVRTRFNWRSSTRGMSGKHRRTRRSQASTDRRSPACDPR